MLRPRRISVSHRDAFLERYEGLHAWAVQMTANDRALAEDLLHDLFILFTLNQPDLNAIDNLDHYLYVCLRNLHISQLRRATRGRFEQLSLIEYDSARLSLHSIAPGRDWVQVQDELRRICHYANGRKATANAASVLILRFFHGYYPSEIAKVLRVTCAAVNKRLLAARVEAKAYLENSGSLSFINKETPEVFPAKFARTPTDFLLELQETIFRSRPGECLDRKELQDLYASHREGPVARKYIAHIVSCPVCLDTVNNLLGLPPLAERYPTDTMDKDNKKGGGPPEDGDKGGSVRKIKDWEREAGEAFEHTPQELCVSVNGYLLGSQLIGSEWSELTLNVAVEERISFCEVFSEQGVRLMMMNVDELPPSGPGEISLSISLSEARTLESTLLFSNPFPTLHVTYRDPALATNVVTEALSASGQVGIATGFYDNDPDSDLAARTDLSGGPRVSSIKRLVESGSTLAHGLRERIFKIGFWSQPATVTALIAIALIVAAIVLQLRRAAPILTAADLLRQSVQAEEAIASNRNQVLHRTINLEEKILSSAPPSGKGSIAVLGPQASAPAPSPTQTLIENTGRRGRLLSQEEDAQSSLQVIRKRIEIWQSADRGLTARRLYDDKGQLIAGDWRRADGVQTLYHHGSKPQLQPAPDKRAATAAFDPNNIWQLAPSSKDFFLLIGSTSEPRLEDRGNAYVLFAESAQSAAHVQAALTLNKLDLHATELVITTADRQWTFTELSFERRPPNAVAPVVFEPEPELLSATETRGRVDAENIAVSPRPSIPASPVVATAGLEIEVLRLLNQVDADFGEQVNVRHTPEGQLLVEGVVETAQRKTEIFQALSSVRNDPALRVDIVTPEEAARRQARSASGSMTLQDVSPASTRIPADEDLRRYFAARGMAGQQLDGEIQRFADRTLARSRQTMVHAHAIRNLVQRFSAESLRTLEPEARLKWLSLIRGHAELLLRDLKLQDQELNPIFSHALATGDADSFQLTDDASLLRAVERLFDLCATRDETIRSAFSISSDASSASAFRSQQFWSSLKNSEALAEKIVNVR
jgi:RNA polymerase sigma factor (sigma-70 family)